MTNPPPPGTGDQWQPPPDPLYQPDSGRPPVSPYPGYQPPTGPPIEAYQPPPASPVYPAYPPQSFPPQSFPPSYAGQALPGYQPPDQAYPVPAYQLGYGDPYGYGPYQQRQTDGLAVASLVVSCVAVPALCLYGVAALIGIVGAILGHVARRRIGRSGANGAGMALAGIIVGWIAAALGLIATIGIIVLIVNSDG